MDCYDLSDDDALAEAIARGVVAAGTTELPEEIRRMMELEQR